MNEELQEAIEFMTELSQDSGVPKSIKVKLTSVVAEIKTCPPQNLSLTINKLLSDLDDMSNDANLDSFTRQQLWSISSILESVETQ